MDRTAEEFVHRLPGGRWFVGDFVRTNPDGQDVFLVEIRRRTGVELTMDVIARPGTGVVSNSPQRQPSTAPVALITDALAPVG